MKKLLAVLMVAMLVLGMVACAPAKDAAGDAADKAEKAGESVAKEAKDAAESVASEAGDLVESVATEVQKAVEGAAAAAAGTVHVFYYDYGDTYISSVRAALDKAFDDAGIAYQDYDSANDQAKQTEQVDTAITNDAALLVVNIVKTDAEDAAMDIVKKAEAKGIPVIFFNREVTDDVVKAYDKVTFVGTNAPEAGHLEGKMIGDYLVANFDAVDLNKDGKISYVLFKGEQGNNEAEARTQFAVEDANKVLSEAGKPELEFYDAANSDKYLVDQGGKWSAQAANEYMNTILSAYSEANKNMVEVVIANNDAMAMGAISGLNDAGYNKGEGSTMIPVFGVDATEEAKQAIKDKKMVGTIKQDAEGMANTICAIVANLFAGKDTMDGVTAPIDEGIAKIRVPYAVYLGE